MMAASGALLSYQSGAEYSGIFPCWDYTRIPGTTARHDIAEISSDVHQMGPTAFVGGCSDGLVGLAAMDFISGIFSKAEASQRIMAHKAWFFLPEGVVAVVANLTFAGLTSISTTLEQNIVQEVAVVGDYSGQHPITFDAPQASNFSQAEWVHHGNTLYTLPQPGAITVFARNVSGSWARISAAASNAHVRMPIFMAELNHDTGPGLAANFIYAVLPAISLAAAPATQAVFWKRTKMHLNTAAAQVLLYQAQGGVLYSMFAVWQPNVTFTSPVSPLIATVSAPCLLVVKQAAKLLTVTAANPLNAALVLHLSLRGEAASAEPSGNVVCTGSSVIITLPDGDTAGSSVSGSCTLLH